MEIAIDLVKRLIRLSGPRQNIFGGDLNFIYKKLSITNKKNINSKMFTKWLQYYITVFSDKLAYICDKELRRNKG